MKTLSKHIKSKEVLARDPHYSGAHLILAATYGMLWRTEEAEWEALELLNLRPDFSLKQARDTAHYRRPADLARYIEGLRRAGLR